MITSKIDEDGIECMTTKCDNDKIVALRSIVKNKQFAMIDDVIIDLFSANLTCQVYDALSSANRIKLEMLKIDRMVNLALKIYNNHKGK